MALIDLTYVKSQFPKWEEFIRQNIGETAPDVDTRLQNIIDNSEAQLSEYAVVTATAIVGHPLIVHLMNLVKKRCFDVKHSATSFEAKPAIVRDYEHTLAMLLKYQKGLLKVPLDSGAEDTQTDVNMKGAGKKFTEWF